MTKPGPQPRVNGILPLINPKKENTELVDNRSKKYAASIKRGRPRLTARKKIDTKQLYMLSQTLLPMESVALILGTSVDTISRHYGMVVAEARENRKFSLLQKMWQNALDKGSEKMQIWLSKQYLGHKESWPEQGLPVSININIVDIP